MIRIHLPYYSFVVNYFHQTYQEVDIILMRIYQQYHYVVAVVTLVLIVSPLDWAINRIINNITMHN